MNNYKAKYHMVQVTITKQLADASEYFKGLSMLNNTNVVDVQVRSEVEANLLRELVYNSSIKTYLVEPRTDKMYRYMIDYYGFNNVVLKLTVTITRHTGKQQEFRTDNTYDYQFDDYQKDITFNCVNTGVLPVVVDIPENTHTLRFDIGAKNVYGVYGTARNMLCDGSNLSGEVNIGDCEVFSAGGCYRLTKVIGNPRVLNLDDTSIDGVYQIPDACEYFSAVGTKITGIKGTADMINVRSTRQWATAEHVIPKGCSMYQYDN